VGRYRPGAEPPTSTQVALANDAPQDETVAVEHDHPPGGLVHDAGNAPLHGADLAAVGKHLPVEPEAAILTALVERGEDLAPRAHSHPCTRLEPEIRGRRAPSVGRLHRILPDSEALAYLLDDDPDAHGDKAPRADVSARQFSQEGAHVPIGN